MVKRNARASLVISAAGIVLPFGVGAGIAVPIYHHFVDPTKVTFGHFILFVGVAISITAFPVLCRILTETRLLDTEVGVITLSAGVGNDVVGWILLALTVALVNATTGLTALYVLLACVGFILFILFPVKWAYRALARFDGSLDRGEPTTFMMTVTLLLVFISAFFTDIIGERDLPLSQQFQLTTGLVGLGVHAIFGGFIAGLIIPKDGGYSIKIVEKLEDLVGIIFIPIVSNKAFLLISQSTHLPCPIAVLRFVRSQDQFGFARQRHHLGICHHYLLDRFLRQIHRMLPFCQIHGLQPPRIRCDWGESLSSAFCVGTPTHENHATSRL